MKNEEIQKERELLVDEYSHLETVENYENRTRKRYGDLVCGAANIRKELKKNFPGIKFSVRSSSYSGGCSIDINWTDGPTTDKVDKIIWRFSEGSFDGMTDSYSYTRDPFTGIFGGAKYIMTNRSISNHLTQKVAAGLGYNLSDEDFDQWGCITTLTGPIKQMIYRETYKFEA